MPTLKWAAPPPGDPTLEGWQQNTYNQGQNLGKSGRYYKDLLNRLGSGDDVSSFGEFNTIRQGHAANRRDIGDSYLYGGNALIANAGGEQANIMNRMRDTAVAKDYEREGTETGQALGQLRGEAASGFQNAFDAKQNRILQQQGMAMNNRLGYYDKRNQSYMAKSGWDKFMDVANLAVSGAGAAAGLGFKPGASGGCWIAEALYGVDDSRTHLLRAWINLVWAEQSSVGLVFAALYLKFGERAAKAVKRNRLVRGAARLVFGYLLKRARAESFDNKRWLVEA